LRWKGSFPVSGGGFSCSARGRAKRKFSHDELLVALFSQAETNSIIPEAFRWISDLNRFSLWLIMKSRAAQLQNWLKLTNRPHFRDAAYLIQIRLLKLIYS